MKQHTGRIAQSSSVSGAVYGIALAMPISLVMWGVIILGIKLAF